MGGRVGALRRGGVAVAVLGALVLGGVVVAAAGPSEPPGAWTGAEVPADLRSETFDPELVGEQDPTANEFADLAATPGAPDADGCEAVPAGSSSPLPLFDGEVVEFVVSSARLCPSSLGPRTLLVVDGAIRDQDTQEVLGAGVVTFARPSAADPFTRSNLRWTVGAACYLLSPTDGFPADASATVSYLHQGWNLVGDPTVDCNARTVTGPSTTTTTAGPTTTSPSSTSTTSQPRPGPRAPSPAAAVPGSPAYTG